MATWPDRVELGAQVEFAIVYPRLEEADTTVVAQVVVVQSPQDDQRSLLMTVRDSAVRLICCGLCLWTRIPANHGLPCLDVLSSG